MNINKLDDSVEPLNMLLQFSLNRRKQNVEVSTGKGYSDD